VLPFTNISPDPNDAYFADGLTEEVISVLSQVRGLDVIARTSVTPYKLAPKPVAQVGAELGVDLVLEGSVRKAGNRIRITLQLVDAVTQGHLWASSYNRELTDVFEVQSDIAERTAQALQLEFAKGRARGGDHRPTPDLEAYDEYLRGLVWAFAPEGSGVDEAVRCFERATTRDPQFAEAFAAWANLYVSMAGDFLPMAEVMPRARELAARALELDPNCSEAHSTLGNIAFQFDQDWSTSEAEFRRAIALNPSNVTAYQFFGMMLMALQRLDEAREAINRAVRLDPGGNERWSLAYLEILAGHWDLAEAVARAELIADPSSMKGHIYLGLYAARAGRWDVARAQAAVPWTGRSEDQRFDHALLNALVGHPEEGRTIIAEAERGEPRSYTSLTHLAIMYAALGDAPKSLDLLERAYREGDRVLWLFYPGVWFDPLRHDPRFVALLQRYGVPRWEPHGGQPSGPSGS
jgi:TolB-like protein